MAKTKTRYSKYKVGDELTVVHLTRGVLPGQSVTVVDNIKSKKHEIKVKTFDNKIKSIKTKYLTD